MCLHNDKWNGENQFYFVKHYSDVTWTNILMLRHLNDDEEHSTCKSLSIPITPRSTAKITLSSLDENFLLTI